MDFWKVKTSFAKIGHTTLSKPQWVGFSSKKTDCDNWKVGEKKNSYPCLGFFYQNHPPANFSLKTSTKILKY